jgi:hypothetical protein
MAEITEIHGDEEERLDANDSGIFTWDLGTGMMQADTSIARLFGLKVSDTLAGLPIRPRRRSLCSVDRLQLLITKVRMPGDLDGRNFRIDAIDDYIRGQSENTFLSIANLVSTFLKFSTGSPIGG